MKMARHTTPALEAVVKLFCPSAELIGSFREVEADDISRTYQTLLAHDRHMTVTVEAFHKSKVDVQVLDTHITSTHYSRKILLTRQSDGAVVQYGIVRLNFSYLPEDAQAEIESQQTPLGRVLIEHNVLRQVMLLNLWEIVPGSELQNAFQLESPAMCYGRTALIYCNNIPAVELLEIMPPLD